MNPTQAFKLAVGMAVQQAKKLQCQGCGHVGMRPAGPPKDRKSREPRDAKLFLYEVRAEFVCPVCNRKHAYMQRSWHNRDTGQKVIPSWVNDGPNQGRN